MRSFVLALLIVFVAAAVAQAEIVGLWACDEASGSTVADSSGYGNDGTISGTVLRSTDVPFTYDGNHSLDFTDASPGYVDCGNDSSLSVESGSFTVMAWIKSPNLTGDDTIMARGLSGAANSAWSLMAETYQRPGPRLRLYMREGGGAATPIITGYIQIGNDEQWRHVAAVVDRSTETAYLYVNGVLDVSGATNGADPSSTQPLKIGRHYNATYNWHDYIDEVVVCSTALSQTEIQWFVNNSVHAIPEPGTMMLLVVGLGTLALVIGRGRRLGR